MSAGSWRDYLPSQKKTKDLPFCRIVHYDAGIVIKAEAPPNCRGLGARARVMTSLRAEKEKSRQGPRAARRPRKPALSFVEGRSARAGLRRFLARESPCEKTAKRNAGQPVENTQFGEIVDSAASMISMACGPDAK
jgi:hypothetical protein